MDKFTEMLLALPLFDGKKHKMEAMQLYAARIICAILVMISLGMGIYAAIEIEVPYQNEVYKTSIENNVAYNVDLLDNDYFAMDSMGMNTDYIRKLVEKINIAFNSECYSEGDGASQISCTVKGVVSTWYIDGDKEKRLWAQERLLHKSDHTLAGDGDYQISVPISVDQNIYYETVQAFQEQLELSVNGYYDVIFEINVVHNSNGEIEKETVQTIVSVPLNGKIFSVNVTSPQEKSEKVFTETLIASRSASRVPATIFFIAAFLFICLLLLLLLCCEVKLGDAYLIKLKNMISSLEDRIVYTQNPRAFSDEDTAVKDFESIVRFADERALPVLCMRDDEAREAIFYVTENYQRYYYLFSEDNTEAERAEETEE